MEPVPSSETRLHERNFLSARLSHAWVGGFSPGRAESAIAVGRLVLAASGLVAIYLDPAAPAKHEVVTYSLLTLYAAYSAVICLIAVASPLRLVRAGLVVHLVDVAICTVLGYLTEGPPSSSFFVYFVFSVLAGHLRWQQRGALWTGGASLLVLCAATAAELGIPDALNRLLIRGGYLVVLTAILTHLGRYELSNRDDLMRLALCPTRMPLSLEPLVAALLDYAVSLVPARRLVMVWDHDQEPFVHVAQWRRGRTALVRHHPGTFVPLVAGGMAQSDFLRRGMHDIALVGGAFRALPPDSVVLNTEFSVKFAVRDVICVRLDGEHAKGWLFFLDKPVMSVDDLVLATLLARQIRDRIDHHYLTARLRTTSARDERIRVRRDIHDSVLQTLTALALQLKAVHQMIVHDPKRAAELLAELEELTTREQLNIRLAVSAARPPAPVRLVSRLRALTAEIASQWSLTVDLVGDEGCAELLDTLTPEIQGEIYHLTREALINAGRHSGASAVRVDIEVKEGMVAISVRDNGHGFPFAGTYALTDLAKLGLGPLSLKQRLSGLRGDLAVTSSTAGTTLQMSVPAVARRA